MHSKAMHNLRTDRANTTQTLNGEAVIDSATEKAIRDYRDTENPAMKSAAELSASVDFTDQKTLLPKPDPPDGGAESAASRVLGMP